MVTIVIGFSDQQTQSFVILLKSKSNGSKKQKMKRVTKELAKRAQT
jgi:hypothetical protein